MWRLIWSTHEDPNDCNAVKVAYALGGRMFERHVGVATDTVKLNAYSSTPAQADNWRMMHGEKLSGCTVVLNVSPLNRRIEGDFGVAARRFLKHPMASQRSPARTTFSRCHANLAS